MKTVIFNPVLLVMQQRNTCTMHHSLRCSIDCCAVGLHYRSTPFLSVVYFTSISTLQAKYMHSPTSHPTLSKFSLNTHIHIKYTQFIPRLKIEFKSSNDKNVLQIASHSCSLFWQNYQSLWIYLLSLCYRFVLVFAYL